MDTHHKTLILCATAKSGLGHIRRLTLIAEALHRRHPDVCLVLLSNAKVAGIDRQQEALFADIVNVPKTEMANYARARKPDALLVYTAALPGIEALDCKRVLMLRESVQEKLSSFALPSGQRWDLLLTPNPLEEWQPPLAQIPAIRGEAVGWIYSDGEPVKIGREKKGLGGSSGRVRDVLIASGGGGAPDWREIVDTLSLLIAKLRTQIHCRLIVRQVIGPRANACHNVAGIDGVISNGGNLQAYFSKQDLVISTAGYNSVLELARTSVPVVLIPVGRSFDDQFKRVQRWGSTLGHAWNGEIEPSLLPWMQEVLEQRLRRRPVSLGISGAALAADLVAETMLNNQG